MDLLNLNGPEFLKAYAGVLAIALALALLTRAVLRRSAGGRPPPNFNPSPFDLAYLAGGDDAVGRTALATLVHRGAVKVDPAKRKFQAADAVRGTLSPPEAAVYDLAWRSGPQAARAVRRAVEVPADGIRARLVLAGLATSAGQALAIRLLPAVPLLLALALGIAKVNVGLSRHRPIGFLGVMLAVASVVTLVLLFASTRTTRAGDRLKAEAKRKESALQATARSSPTTLGPGDAAMAFALFGPVVFAAGPIHDTRRFFEPATAGGGSCGSSCGGGGGDSGGGGGCGGGGCGGCGGG